MPELDDVCTFYLDLYNLCGDSVSELRAVSDLYGMTPTEIIETAFILKMISSELMLKDA